MEQPRGAHQLDRGQARASELPMDWKKLPAYISGSVEEGVEKLVLGFAKEPLRLDERSGSRCFDSFQRRGDRRGLHEKPPGRLRRSPGSLQLENRHAFSGGVVRSATWCDSPHAGIRDEKRFLQTTDLLFGSPEVCGETSLNGPARSVVTHVYFIG